MSNLLSVIGVRTKSFMLVSPCRSHPHVLRLRYSDAQKRGDIEKNHFRHSPLYFLTAVYCLRLWVGLL